MTARLSKIHQPEKALDRRKFSGNEQPSHSCGSATKVQAASQTSAAVPLLFKVKTTER
jgi:hypothetical protein